jgi:hypothetical protein
MPTLKINENQFRHNCRDAKVRCRYSFVAGSFKQAPYVLIEWDNRANHVHVELRKLSGGKYYRLTGDNPNKLTYEFEMTGFHIKLKEEEKVHEYMGFVLNGLGVWDAGWRKVQTETTDKEGRQVFEQGALGEESEAFLLTVGRSFIKDLGTVTGKPQQLGRGFGL